MPLHLKVSYSFKYLAQSLISSVMNLCARACFAENLAVGSIFRHLLKKSKNRALSDPILAFMLVILGVYTLTIAESFFPREGSSYFLPCFSF